MRTIIIATLVALGVSGTAALADEHGSASGGTRQWLSIGQIHARLEAAGYRNVEKIERERGGYEVKATDRNGDRIKLYLNPQTGDILDRRQGETRHDQYGKIDAASGRRNSGDCNQRRCRDDLPQPGAATAPAAR